MVVTFDEIGYWSELKLEIVRKYAAAYSRILAAQRSLQHIYVDAFAGPGMHVSRARHEWVPGSPLNALQVEPPFREYHLIDLDGAKVEHLRALVGERADVRIYEGDCNVVLLQNVFPGLTWGSYRRALVLLDPYGLHLAWDVIAEAGRLRTVDIFLNFPVMDMNRNVLWRRPAGVSTEDTERMNRFWGDESWRTAAYPLTQLTVFGDPEPIKGNSAAIAAAFRERLRRVAAFGHVPEPLPMRNSTGAVVYYLFFASQKAVAGNIITDIFATYRNRGA